MQGQKAESNENTYFQQFARRKCLARLAKSTQNHPTLHSKYLIINALQAIASKNGAQPPFPPAVPQS